MKHQYKIDLEDTTESHYVFVCVRCGTTHGILKRAFLRMGTEPTWRGNVAYWWRWQANNDAGCVELEKKPTLIYQELDMWFVYFGVRSG